MREDVTSEGNNDRLRRSQGYLKILLTMCPTSLRKLGSPPDVDTWRLTLAGDRSPLCA